MARRYRAKHSPGASPAAGNRTPHPLAQDDLAHNDLAHNDLTLAKPSRAGGRANLLFFAPLPLIWKAFGAQPITMATYLAGLATLLLAAWLTQEGLKAQDAYDARKIARRPAIPRKLFGAVLTGAGLGLVGIAGHGPVDAMIFAALGIVLHLAAFGLDPMKSKGLPGVDDFQSDRAARAIEDAEKRLQAMRQSIAALNDRALLDQVDRFQSTARHMFRLIENDPSDLTAARKYLSVYLDAAQQASDKFAALYARNASATARDKYESLLIDLECRFSDRTQKLLADDRIDLDIEIDVLRDRLQREGVTLGSSKQAK